MKDIVESGYVGISKEEWLNHLTEMNNGPQHYWNNYGCK